jgi:hypothetical protein
MRKIFKDDELEKKFNEDGYVVIPFLNKDELSGLIQTYANAQIETSNQFYASAHDSSLEVRMNMSEEIKTAFTRSSQNTLINMELLGGSYIVKPKQYQHILQAHQDWNIVDEDQYVSCNIWIPLVDTTKNNGAILVMPKSHNWIKSIRHSSIPCSFSSVHDLLIENMLTLDIKAGEALIYNHALIHASHENQSNEARPACALGIKPKEAEMLFYWNNNGVIEEYKCNPEFFMNENVFSGPGNLQKIKTIDYSFPKVDDNMFYALSNIPQPIVLIEEKQETLSVKELKLPFWKIYTPLNIVREVLHRLKT